MIQTHTRKVWISVWKRVDPLPTTTHERWHQGVLFRWDVINLEAHHERKSNSTSGNARNETEEQCSSVDYHLPVGEEGNIWDGLEGLRHAVEVGAAAVAHVGVEHGLGDILGVVLVRPVELVLQVIDAVLLLIPRYTRAPCNSRIPLEHERARQDSAEIGERALVLHCEGETGDLPLRRLKRVLHCGQFCVPSRRSYS